MQMGALASEIYLRFMHEWHPHHVSRSRHRSRRRGIVSGAHFKAEARGTLIER